MARILVTNDGPHPAEKWAMATAEELFPMQDAGLTGDHLIAAQRFQLDLAEALEDHHCNVQDTENEKLEAVPDHCENDLDVGEHVEAAMAAVTAKAEGTPWQGHFAKPEVIDAVRLVLETHFRAAAHIERLWHADRNPHNEIARNYKAQFHG